MIFSTTRTTSIPGAAVRSPIWTLALVIATVLTAGTSASAQTFVAVPDAYTAPSGDLLQVEAPGVMENDHDGGGEPPPPPTVEARLDSGVSHGLLTLSGDGSFDYISNQGFVGVDTFTYYFFEGAATSNITTVTITVEGCEPGLAPTQWVCWIEEAYLAKAALLGLSTTIEGFEDDGAWGVTRSPLTEPSVVSQGITWASNLGTNEISTGGGPAHTGLWAFYSEPHGVQTGAPGTRTRDGFTGTAPSPDSLLGIGGWIKASQIGSQLDLIVTHDGGSTTTAAFPDHSLSYDHRFFGIIDTAGFTSFEVVETDGTINQPYFIYGDTFSVLTAGADTTPPQVLSIGSWADTGDGVLSEGESTDVAITELTVRLNEAVKDLPGDTDPDDVTNPANYLLFDDNGDGFDTVDCAGGVAAGDNPVNVSVMSYASGSPSETLLEVNGGFSLPAGSYRLLVCGTTSIVDWADNPLDGNGDGSGGDDFVRNFDITLTINHPPVADPQSVSTPEDTPVDITLTGSDIDGDPIVFFLATNPTKGTLTGVPPNLTYTPFADTNGIDSFTFEVEDDDLISDPARVTIDVTPVNDGPIANNQAVETVENVPLPITLTGSDIDGDILNFALGTGPAHGVLTGAPPNVTYSPTSGYNGPDSFTFTVSDATVTSSAATVSITVTPWVDSVLTIGDTSIVEPDTGTATATLVITLSEPSPLAIDVDFATTDVSATAGSDYIGASGTLTIPALTATYDLTVEINGDVAPEMDETFSVTLSNAIGAALGTPSTATVTILDNEAWIWFVATDGDDMNDCVTAATACRTISEAVSRAADGDLINVAQGVYPEHLLLGVDLTIAGELPTGTVIDGGGTGVVIDISPATTIVMSGFEIRNGGVGGVVNRGDLTLEDSWIHDNGDGLPSTFGGLQNQGTALVDRVAITANHGDTSGGVSNAGLLEIRNSTVSGNSAGVVPGIDNLSGAILDLVYSTVASNGDLGIRAGGTTSLRCTIIAGHTTANCDTAAITLGHNLEDGDTCGFHVFASDLIGVDPLLTPLSHLGGSSPTHAIQAGSPAMDAGESAGFPATDQRGVNRPIDGDLDGTATSDIGAFEATPDAIFNDGFESGDTSAWSG